MNKIIIAFAALFACSAAAAQNQSVYTSLVTKDCRTIESNPEEAGWYRGECRGTAGYKLEVTEGDLRQSVSVIAPSRKKFELNFGNVSSGFSSVGAKAEWRVSGKKLVALIVRFDASENPEDSTKITSYLIVSKVTPKSACIVDVVKPSKNQNADARKIADGAATMPCKSFD